MILDSETCRHNRWCRTKNDTPRVTMLIKINICNFYVRSSSRPSTVSVKCQTVFVFPIFFISKMPVECVCITNCKTDFSIFC